MRLRFLLLACAVAVAGCDRTETVSIGLDPDPFQIVTQGTDPTGEGSITIDPSDAGSDYLDNRSKIDSVALASLKLEIVSVNAFAPANVATQLESATLEITDESSLQTHRYVVSRVVPIAVTPTPADYIDLGVIQTAPDDPAPLAINVFLSEILKGAHVFTLHAVGTVDAAPVNVSCRLHFAINLEIEIGLFD